jgi:hypothetical protein
MVLPNNNLITPLCELGYKYGTDKCPQIKHSYTPIYYELLKDRRFSIKKVLEVGIGLYRKNHHQPEQVFQNGIQQYLRRGASLYMWRDFFPNAQIYGADNRPETIFADERITTFLCDERLQEDMEKLVENIGSDIDFVVDDASHHVADQILLAQNLLPLLKKDVLYIIEDVGHSKKIRSALPEYDIEVIDVPRKWHGGMMVVITNKS